MYVCAFIEINEKYLYVEFEIINDRYVADDEFAGPQFGNRHKKKIFLWLHAGNLFIKINRYLIKFYCKVSNISEIIKLKSFSFCKLMCHAGFFFVF